MFEQKATRSLPFLACLLFSFTFCCAFNTAVRKNDGQTLSTELLKLSRLGSIASRSDTPILIYSAQTEDPMDGARHTYVEGGTYDDQFSEIEAMGGDPFFLEDEVSKSKMAKKVESMLAVNEDGDSFPQRANKRYATDGKGPSPKKEAEISDNTDADCMWDGIVDEHAHMDWD